MPLVRVVRGLKLVVEIRVRAPTDSGEVVAVGDGRYAENGKLVAPEVSAGESVMYSPNRGSEANIEGKKFVIISEVDCLAMW